DPDLLMLDEPVAGMSVSERVQTAELLKRISQGRSVLVIEHDMEFVKSIAHKVTVLHQGKVLAEGSMEAVQSNPKVIEVCLGHCARASCFPGETACGWLHHRTRIWSDLCSRSATSRPATARARSSTTSTWTWPRRKSLRSWAATAW